MASVASQLIEEVTVHAQSDGLEDVREICADGTYFPNNLRTIVASILQSSGTHEVRVIMTGTQWFKPDCDTKHRNT